MVKQKIRSLISTHPLFCMLRREKAEVYIVGGFYPSLNRGHKVNDLDLVADDLSELKAMMEREFKREFALIEDKRGHRVLKFHLEGMDFDITEIDGSLASDSKRRDFTFNSIYYDPVKEAILDPMDGVADFQKNLIRPSSPVAFASDPIRIIRYFRFKHRYGLSPTADAISQIEALSPDALDSVSVERITQELKAVFSLPLSWKILSELESRGFLNHIFTSIEQLKGVSQNEYHSFDILEHSLLCVKWVEYYSKTFPGLDAVLIKLSALFHDQGKAATRCVVDGRVSFYRHERVGADMAREELSRLRFSKQLIKDVGFLVEQHMYPAFLKFDKALSDKAIRKFMRRTDDLFEELMVLFLADGAAAHDKRDIGQEEFAKFLIDKRSQYLEEIKRLPEITGKELIAMGFVQGPYLGNILEEINEGLHDGRFKDRREALEYAKNHLHKDQ